MPDTFKFPNGGYDVTICRKKDILECIDKNIIDKDVALAIVSHCEYTAAEHINKGIWSSIPFIGSIRKSKTKNLLESDEQQALIAEAKANLDKEQYIMFRKRLNRENSKQVSHERYYKYMTSIAVNNNRKLYNRLCKTKGEAFARLFLFCSYEVTAVNNEYIKLEDDELQTDNR